MDWLEQRKQSITLFAMYPSGHPSGYDLLLLALLPTGDKERLHLCEHLEFVLLVYRKKMANVVADVGENENKDKAVARLITSNSMGCYRHW